MCRTDILALIAEIKMPELCYAYRILITSFLTPLDCINMILKKLLIWNMQSYLLQYIHSIRVEIPTPGYHLVTFSYSSRHLSIEFLLSPSAISTCSIFPETKSDTLSQ